MHITTSADREQARSASARAAALRDPVLRRAGLIGLAWLVGYDLTLALVNGDTLAGQILWDGVYMLPWLVALLLMLIAARRRSGRERVFWGLLGAAIAATSIGDSLWLYYGLVKSTEPPYPFAGDAFYIASYVLVIAAIVIGFARASSRRLRRVLLDTSILMLAVAYLFFQLLIEPQLGTALSLEAVVSVAYPLLATALLMLIVCLVLSGYRQVSLAMLAVGAACAIWTVTDGVFIYGEGIASLGLMTWTVVGWQVQAVLLCLAGLGAIRHDDGSSERERRPKDVGRVPLLIGVLAMIAVALPTAAAENDWVGPALMIGYAVAALALRFHLTSRENERITRRLEHALAEQERLAVTDALTGLHNRRFFEEVLALEAGRALRSGRSLGLLVLDLDHFKSVNDKHGHVAGDRVLAGVAQRFSHCVRESDVVARYGGEEFVILLPEVDAEVLLELAERCRRTIERSPVDAGRAGEIQVTVSVGGALMPQDAGSATDLVKIADRALYTAKWLGRNRVQMGVESAPADPEDILGSSSVLLFLHTLVDELDHAQAPAEHGRLIAQVASAVADELGLDDDAQRRCAIAGRFHDVGKVAVPQSVLQKPGPLDAAEWELVKQHPAHGARLLELVPELADVAPIVNDHHERFDGKGYPAGKTGKELSIEARIISVCDSWAAMRADRPYRPALSHDRALAEIRAGAGTQFDPDVVDAFVSLAVAGALDDGTPAASLLA